MPLLTETTCTIVWHEAKTLFQHPLHQNNNLSWSKACGLWDPLKLHLRKHLSLALLKIILKRPFVFLDLTYISLWDAFPTLNHTDSPFRAEEEAY